MFYLLCVQGSDVCSMSPPTITCSCPAGAAYCQQNADGSVSIANSPANNASVVTCTAVSASTGLSASCTSKLLLVDTVAPAISCSISNAQAQCGAAAVVVSATVRAFVCLLTLRCFVQATDSCEGSVLAVCSGNGGTANAYALPSPACVHPLSCVFRSDGSYSMPAVSSNNGAVVSCKAFDSSGNMATCSETISVVAVAPIITCNGPSSYVECNPNKTVSFSASVCSFALVFVHVVLVGG